MPPSGDENDVGDEMVGERKRSAPSDNEDQVNASQENYLVKIQQKRSDNDFQFFR